MASFDIVIGDMVANFKLDLSQSREAVTIEELGFKAASKQFGMGVVVAVATLANVLLSAVAGKQLLEAGGRVLTALVGEHDEPGRRPTYHQGPTQRFADQVFGHGVVHVPAHYFA